MSDYMKKLVQQAEEGLLDWDAGLEELARDKQEAVEADSFDKLAWQMLSEQVPKLGEQSQRLIDEFGDALGQAMEDLFNLLHQGDPRFSPRDAMLGEYEINLIVLMDLAETEEFKALYDETRYDEYQTAFAMLTMEEFVRAAFEKVQEAREQMREAREQQGQAMQDLANAVDEAMQGDGGDPQALEQALDAAQQAQAAVDAAQQAGQQSAGQAVEELRQGAMKAKEEIQAEEQLLGGWGNDPGELQRMSFAERRALAQKIAGSRLKKFAEMIGQFRMFADAERRRKVKHAPAEVYDYELTNDLTRLHSSEMVNLAVPETEDLFWLRYAQHGLVTKLVRGPEKKGKGPVIVVCDESMSMGTGLDMQGNSRECWSKALALALCDQAKRNKRDFTYIGFASEGQDWQMDFPGGVTPIEQVIEFTEHFYGGGTHYERPLTRAMEIVESYEANGQVKPDIVFITDDECRVDPDFITYWRKVKERTEASVFGITLGGSRFGTMEQLADRAIAIDTLSATPHGVQELFREI